MRIPVLCLTLLAALPAPAETRAEITSVETCTAAVAADPAAAREEAARWARTGGGVAARLCEADALAALGAHTTAATLLTRLAENPNRVMGADLRAIVLGDAAREWLAAGQPDLAAAALAQADRIAPPDATRLVLAARAAAATGDFAAARVKLEQAIAMEPGAALPHALLAAALRNLDQPAAAEAEAATALQLSPDLPEALFEAAALRAEAGDLAGANRLWQRLIALDPGSTLAALARTNLQALN